MPCVEERTDVQSDCATGVPHLFATIDALTDRGGRVTKATSGLTIAGLTVARVGDAVTYRDGSELDNGDTIAGGRKRLSMVSSRVFTVGKRSSVNG
ncbi:hypothetical protein HpMS107_15590 [Helicobacter pylori]|jgi:uncharacterized Zn-binding protein involved in type VI secretion|uniref:PAAR domain-containing protein n=1 Tax=Cupriavidus TaxID=106589 RepID=UPI000B1CCE8F